MIYSLSSPQHTGDMGKRKRVLAAAAAAAAELADRRYLRNALQYASYLKQSDHYDVETTTNTSLHKSKPKPTIIDQLNHLEKMYYLSTLRFYMSARQKQRQIIQEQIDNEMIRYYDELEHVPHFDIQPPEKKTASQIRNEDEMRVLTAMLRMTKSITPISVKYPTLTSNEQNNNDTDLTSLDPFPGNHDALYTKIAEQNNNDEFGEDTLQITPDELASLTDDQRALLNLPSAMQQNILSKLSNYATIGVATIASLGYWALANLSGYEAHIQDQIDTKMEEQYEAKVKELSLIKTYDDANDKYYAWPRPGETYARPNDSTLSFRTQDDVVAGLLSEAMASMNELSQPIEMIEPIPITNITPESKTNVVGYAG